MKIIHCADLHLDSKLNTHLDAKKSKARKREILHTFERMIEYAKQEGVKIILISGDLFDSNHIDATARNVVVHAIETNPEIHFYYLRGNHDSDYFLSDFSEIPKNLFRFGEDWKTYRELDGKLTISGLELSNENAQEIGKTLSLEEGNYNIVMLHAQVMEHSIKNNEQNICLKGLYGKNIDYLALGHIHAYRQEKLDERGIYCYPGCLEGRGFDECGEHGFVLLDFDESKLQMTSCFVPFAKRNLYQLKVSVEDCQTSAQMAERIDLVLKEKRVKKMSLLRIILVGEVDLSCEKDLLYLSNKYNEDYYFVQIVDETKLKMKEEDYLLDFSLKGEFIRQIMKDETILEEDKKTIIRYGLQVLAGEEVK